ncbi:MAG: hypothetical protein K8E24_015205 [Methanobacterium paludis]|nr:hypothetical protein [Methanobacterium paludis]
MSNSKGFYDSLGLKGIIKYHGVKIWAPLCSYDGGTTSFLIKGGDILLLYYELQNIKKGTTLNILVKGDNETDIKDFRDQSMTNEGIVKTYCCIEKKGHKFNDKIKDFLKYLFFK